MIVLSLQPKEQVSNFTFTLPLFSVLFNILELADMELF